MLDFVPVGLEHKAEFEKYSYANDMRMCDYSFMNIYGWSWTYKTKICFHKGFMLIRFCIKNCERIAYLQPLSVEPVVDYTDILEEMEEDSKAMGYPLRIFSMTEEFATKMQGFRKKEFVHFADRDSFDYLYDANKLKTLSGKKLQSKRNHINRFLQGTNYEFVTLTDEHREIIFDILLRWQKAKGVDPLTTSDERPFVEKALDHREALGVLGGVLYVDGKAVAFTMGTATTESVFDVHIEKSDLTVDNAYQAINYLFANTLPENYMYINREEDMGVEGLRKAKLSYYPLELVKKYSMVAACDVDKYTQLHQIWCEAFGDTPEFAERYLKGVGVSADIRTVESDCKIGAAMYVHRFMGDTTKFAYLYAIATQKECRGQGLASKMISDALVDLYDKGEYLAMLIASDQGLAEWYKNLGFSSVAEAPIELRSTSDHNFGTGDAENDMPQYRVVSALKYLEQYVALRPETEAEFVLRDEVVGLNNGRYLLTEGRVAFTPGAETASKELGDSGEVVSPTELLDRYPLPNTSACLIL